MQIEICKDGLYLDLMMFYNLKSPPITNAVYLVSPKLGRSQATCMLDILAMILAMTPFSDLKQTIHY